MSIEANPIGTCTVVFRSKLTNRVASFEASVLSSPHIFSEAIGYKIIIRGAAFEITHSKIKGNHNTALNFNAGHYASEEREIDEWINYSTFLLILSEGQFSIKNNTQR